MESFKKKFLEDMFLKDYAEATKEGYFRSVRYFFERMETKKKAEDVVEEDLRKYFLHLKDERQYKVSALKIAVSGLRFFFETTLGHRWEIFTFMRGIKDEKMIPTVLDKEDVHRILNAFKKPQYITFFHLLYVCGFRASEALNLRPTDIDAKRMMITIPKSKGKRTRQVPVSKKMILMLRKYWKTHRNPALIFPSRGNKTFAESSSTTTPIKIQAVQEALRTVVVPLNLKKHVTPHTFRHCYATHLLDDGVNIRLVQLFLGHSSIQTTCGYLHVTKHGLENAMKVIENLLKNWKKKGGDDDEQATANI